MRYYVKGISEIAATDFPFCNEVFSVMFLSFQTVVLCDYTQRFLIGFSDLSRRQTLIFHKSALKENIKKCKTKRQNTCINIYDFSVSEPLH